MKVFVTVGTDTHPFDRLVDWADRFAGQHPEVEVLVQYGSSEPPTGCAAVQFLDHEEFLANLRSADVVVTHGGPASIIEAREHHGRPLVLARDNSFGEHVDGHQMAFCAMLDSVGQISYAAGPPDLDKMVQSHLYDGPGSRPDPTGAPVGISRFVEEVEKLFDEPPRSRRVRRNRRRTRTE